MNIEEFVDKITFSTAISGIEPSFLRLLRLTLGKGDVDILTDYHQTGTMKSNDEGRRMETPDVLCFLTEDRIFKLESVFDNGSQGLHLFSWAFEDVSLYEIGSTATKYANGSLLAVNQFSLAFRDGGGIDLRWDSRYESKLLEEFAGKVIERIREGD